MARSRIFLVASLLTVGLTTAITARADKQHEVVIVNAKNVQSTSGLHLANTHSIPVLVAEYKLTEMQTAWVEPGKPEVNIRPDNTLANLARQKYLRPNLRSCSPRD
jgi:hypothetical protein